MDEDEWNEYTERLSIALMEYEEEFEKTEFDFKSLSIDSTSDFDSNLINSNRKKAVGSSVPLSPKDNETPGKVKKKFKKDLLSFLREQRRLL